MPIHIAYTEIAAQAASLGCKRLVLTHLGQSVLDHAGEINRECAHDVMTIEL
jgi:ribonuclease BN (tRNA processing enzyme)